MIFHITKKSAWEKAKVTKEYVTDSLTSEGFIHCSTVDQVALVANQFYKGQKDLCLLVIDTNKLISKFKFEKPELPFEGMSEKVQFPHIYGPINISAVEKVLDFAPDTKGLFHLFKIQ